MAELPDKPFNREETYLASMAGQGVEKPACPWSRKEAYLDAIDGRIADLQEEIEEMENNPDVADIVDTYADLEAYDTSTLTDKDIIRVLNDETHNGESTYYRYSKATDTWTYIGSTGPKGGVQSDWAENDSEDPAYIKNRTHYEETVENTVAQYGSTSAGSTPDSGYVWFIEKVEDYALSDELNVSDGDTVYMDITFSVNGVERTDGAKFEASVENGTVSLDSLAEAGNRWRGAYASELDGDTTFRFPVASADASATVYITGITYQIVKELDAKYIPVDGDTITVDENGKLASTGGGGPTVVQTTGTSTTDVMSQNAVTSMVYADPETKNKIQIGSTALAEGGMSIAIGGEDGVRNPSQARGVRSISIGAGAGCADTGNGNVLIGCSQKASVASNSVGLGTNPDAGSGFNTTQSVALGYNARTIGGESSVALGANSKTSAKGEVNIGSYKTGNYGSNTGGYNNSNYRLLTGLYPGQSEHDAATVGQAKGTTFSMAIETSSWTALSSSDPYTYSATVSIPSTTTIGNDSIVELINDQAVLFGTYGFAITDITGQVVTIASIGQPSADITLKINVRS